MSEELDLTGAKITAENVIYLQSIRESLQENFPTSDLDQDLKDFGISPIELTDRNKFQEFFTFLEEKYPG